MFELFLLLGLSLTNGNEFQVTGAPIDYHILGPYLGMGLMIPADVCPYCHRQVVGVDSIQAFPEIRLTYECPACRHNIDRAVWDAFNITYTAVHPWRGVPPFLFGIDEEDDP